MRGKKLFENPQSPRATTVDVVIIPVEATMSTGWPHQEATEVKEVAANEITNDNPEARIFLHHPNPFPLDLVPIHILEEQGNPR